MADEKAGKVIHFYDKIGVAVVSLSAPIKTGDMIKISGHDKEFSQTVTSMQIEHQKTEQAKKGQVVGMKVDQPVKENDLVYKVS